MIGWKCIDCGQLNLNISNICIGCEGHKRDIGIDYQLTRDDFEKLGIDYQLTRDDFEKLRKLHGMDTPSQPENEPNSPVSPSQPENEPNSPVSPSKPKTTEPEVSEKRSSTGTSSDDKHVIYSPHPVIVIPPNQKIYGFDLKHEHGGHVTVEPSPSFPIPPAILKLALYIISLLFLLFICSIIGIMISMIVNP